MEDHPILIAMLAIELLIVFGYLINLGIHEERSKNK